MRRIAQSIMCWGALSPAGGRPHPASWSIGGNTDQRCRDWSARSSMIGIYRMGSHQWSFPFCTPLSLPNIDIASGSTWRMPRPSTARSRRSRSEDDLISAAPFSPALPLGSAATQLMALFFRTGLVARCSARTRRIPGCRWSSLSRNFSRDGFREVLRWCFEQVNPPGRDVELPAELRRRIGK